MVTITGLYTYPIKSCGALAHEQVEITTTGPAYDRHWVVTDPDGMFYTQRELPQLAQVQPRFAGERLVITAPGMSEISVPLHVRETMPRCEVVVWRDTVEAADMGKEAAAWFSDYLGTAARLFAMPPSTVRAVDAAYAPQPAQVGFADGYPLLVISEESLAALNEKLAARGKDAVPMSRFRPNMVIKGGGAFAEDDLGAFSAGDVTFDVVKPCARCAITTIDQGQGTSPDPKEPLATLAMFRRGDGGKVLFGQNIVHRGEGVVSVGDTLQRGG